MLNDPPKMVHRSTLAFTVLHAVYLTAHIVFCYLCYHSPSHLFHIYPQEEYKLYIHREFHCQSLVLLSVKLPSQHVLGIVLFSIYSFPRTWRLPPGSDLFTSSFPELAL